MVTGEAVRRSGERDREALRERAVQSGPIGEGTIVYRIDLHPGSARASERARPYRVAAASALSSVWAIFRSSIGWRTATGLPGRSGSEVRASAQTCSSS
jgi:hypothetical protein